MPNTQTTTSGDDKHWTRSDFENLQYIAGYDTSTNPPTPIYKPYPSTVYQKTTVVQDSDGNILNQSEYDNDIVTGFTNPNLHRRVDAHEPEQNVNPNLLESTPIEYMPGEICIYTIPLTEPLVAGQKYTIQLWDVNISYEDVVVESDEPRILISPTFNRTFNFQCILYVQNGHTDYLSGTFVASDGYYPVKNSTSLDICSDVPERLDYGICHLSIGGWKLEKGEVATSLYDEVAPRQYDLEVRGVNSYRTTTITVHDEESTTTEIP